MRHFSPEALSPVERVKLPKGARIVIREGFTAVDVIIDPLSRLIRQIERCEALELAEQNIERMSRKKTQRVRRDVEKARQLDRKQQRSAKQALRNIAFTL